jgi:hypothetical protein
MHHNNTSDKDLTIEIIGGRSLSSENPRSGKSYRRMRRAPHRRHGARHSAHFVEQLESFMWQYAQGGSSSHGVT